MLLSNEDKIYKGSISITKAYLGTTLVYVKGETENTIPAYYVQQVEDALNYVADLGTDDWVHHLALADTHYSGYNYRHSIPIVSSLMKSGYFDKFFLLGDITDTTNKDDLQMMVDDGINNLTNKTLFVIGNHDWAAINGVRTISNAEYADALMPNTPVTWHNKDNLEWYYDDTKRKIRYIGVNCGSTVTSHDDLVKMRSDLPSDWTYFVFSHYPSINGYDEDGNVIITALQNLNAFITGYFLTDASCGGWICGHMHFDHMRNDYPLFAQIALDCDMNDMPRRQTQPGWNSDPRDEGTVTEHAITIMSINTAIGEVKFKRIGAYQSHYGDAWSYDLEPYKKADKWVKGFYKSGTFYLAESEYGYTKTPPIKLTELSPNIQTDGDTFYYYKPNIPAESDVYLGIYSSLYLDSTVQRAIGYVRDAVLFPGVGYFKISSDAEKAASVYGLLNLYDNSGVYDPNEDGDFVITREADFDCPIDNSIYEPTWLDGYYVSGSGAATLGSDSDGETLSCALRCEPNTTYTISVADESWTTNWIYVGQYKKNTAFIKRVGVSSSVSSYTFTTDENCHFIAVSSRNLVGNTDKVKIRKDSESMVSITQTGDVLAIADGFDSRIHVSQNNGELTLY